MTRSDSRRGVELLPFPAMRQAYDSSTTTLRSSGLTPSSSKAAASSSVCSASVTETRYAFMNCPSLLYCCVPTRAKGRLFLTAELFGFCQLVFGMSPMQRGEIDFIEE